MSTSSKRTFLWHTLAVAACFVLSSTLAQAESLAKDSPFLPPGWGAKKETPTPPPPPPTPVSARLLQFKGLISLGGTTRFSIFDKKSGKSYWLPLNQLQGDFQVVRYNKDKQSVTVRTGGRTEELKLATADGKPLQIAGAVAPSATQPNTKFTSPAVVTSGPTTRRNPVVPRRRIIRRPNTNNQATTPARPPVTGTPATPLPTPPTS